MYVSHAFVLPVMCCPIRFSVPHTLLLFRLQNWIDCRICLFKYSNECGGKCRQHRHCLLCGISCRIPSKSSSTQRRNESSLDASMARGSVGKRTPRFLKANVTITLVHIHVIITEICKRQTVPRILVESSRRVAWQKYPLL